MRESMEATERDRNTYRDLWRGADKENDRLKARVKELEGALSAIRTVSEAAHSSNRFEEIPF
jgi:hypothetical protein